MPVTTKAQRRALLDAVRNALTAMAGPGQQPCHLREEPVADLRAHKAIPSMFEARSVYEVGRSSDRFLLTEQPIAVPCCKNYDEFEDPLAWPREFDTRRWALISAFAGAQRVGGIVVATSTPGVAILEDRRDLAVLWDVRIAPAHRRQGIGTALLEASQVWARHRACTELKVETQNTNPAACSFYMRRGFGLAQVLQDAYPGLPGDVQLIWRKRLDG